MLFDLRKEGGLNHVDAKNRCNQYYNGYENAIMITFETEEEWQSISEALKSQSALLVFFRSFPPIHEWLFQSLRAIFSSFPFN